MPGRPVLHPRNRRNPLESIGTQSTNRSICMALPDHSKSQRNYSYPSFIDPAHVSSIRLCTYLAFKSTECLPFYQMHDVNIYYP
ncbi:rCG57917 [Rattus norvegicus]|uniref:RCG57917 n=1 Tax=Rattus norvegicus TaxID=10116 RepID=A6J3S3_RAT|nr:rCG57917 [Rattus norvegicus]